MYTKCIQNYAKDIFTKREDTQWDNEKMVWNASFIVQEEFRAKRREVFPKWNLSFWFVIGTAVRNCAQEKRRISLRLCASPQGLTR
ncbi:hypothetical protein EBT31_06630 [bacterium]|jgi:hypothetical protein|nr:hypothetical protein [bacterium]